MILYEFSSDHCKIVATVVIGKIGERSIGPYREADWAEMFCGEGTLKNSSAG